MARFNIAGPGARDLETLTLLLLALTRTRKSSSGMINTNEMPKTFRAFLAATSALGTIILQDRSDDRAEVVLRPFYLLGQATDPRGRMPW